MSTSRNVISTILKHDKKNSSYKIALLRAINDVVLSFPDLATHRKDVAVPLRLLADFWIAYYWPFVEIEHPIMQGRSGDKYDITFRPELTALRLAWERMIGGKSNASDGFIFINELKVIRKQREFSADLLEAYHKTIAKIKGAITQPIRYAGPGEYEVFDRPSHFNRLGGQAVPVPGTQASDQCLVIPFDLWQVFQNLSLWVEALCLHEWCLFVETAGFQQPQGTKADRGDIYRLLTARPDNRRPLTWERNQIDLLIMDNHSFVCPWTEKRLTQPGKYDLDHLLPISVYPTNELWNLVPADSTFNQHRKRDRLPSPERLAKARPHLILAYANYDELPALSDSLHADVQGRFSTIPSQIDDFPQAVSTAVVKLLQQFADSRNLARF